MLIASKTDSVRQHYEPVEGNSDLVVRITEMLNQMEGPLTTKHLAPLDQFHVKGLAGTKELAEMASVQRDMAILDAGSGLGGPSRYLAETYGCHESDVRHQIHEIPAFAFVFDDDVRPGIDLVDAVRRVRGLDWVKA